MKLNSIFSKSIVLLFCCLVFLSLHSTAQNVFPVTGKVTDENGKGLAGVTVTVKGTAVNTVTGPDGAYKINAGSGKAVLVFSYVGYQPAEVAIGGKAVIDHSLALSQKLLDDVVVIG